MMHLFSLSVKILISSLTVCVRSLKFCAYGFFHISVAERNRLEPKTALFSNRFTYPN